MPLRQKYPITQWVLGQDNVNVGDTIAFFCEREQKEVHAEVLGFPSQEYRQYISCRRLDSPYSEVINFYDTIVYRVGEVRSQMLCTCGAKHTSNPSYHLPYCDLAAIKKLA